MTNKLNFERSELMTDDVPGITVLIPTYNRAAVLSQTLEALTSVERSGIDLNIVIIDNNSSDNTGEVVKAYETRLPLFYLRETRPGKSCALNKALRECALKEIVVFADDDITPTPNWFREIVSSVQKWPGISAFGGKIEPIWPGNKQPDWTTPDWIMAFGFSRHHYAEGEAFYKPPACPFGPNFWVRKGVFQKVPFFDETLIWGPTPRNRIMGDEAGFLMELQRNGFEILYYPKAEVYHRILPTACTLGWLRQRAYTHGRGEIRLHGWHRRDIYARSKILWCMVLAVDECYAALRFLGGLFLRNSMRNCNVTVNAMLRFGQLHETAYQLLKRFRPNQADKA
jgi:glucosyl-dolichyl phosphate glucuronosyltransferase